MANTELDAVNTLLIAYGVVPVIDIDSGHPKVQSARHILAKHAKSVQSKKWWFNTEVDVDFSPNSEGYINLPSGVQSLDNSAYWIKNGKLYDPTERTNIFTDEVTGLTLIYARAWEDLPVTAFSYIVALATEEFIRPLSDANRTRLALEDITRTRAELRVTDNRYKDTGKQSGNPLMLKWLGKMKQR